MTIRCESVGFSYVKTDNYKLILLHRAMTVSYYIYLHFSLDVILNLEGNEILEHELNYYPFYTDNRS